MIPPLLNDEMADLLESLCLEELSAADADRLEELVRGDAECCRQYVLFMQMHATAERFGSVEIDAADDEAAISAPPPAINTLSPLPSLFTTHHPLSTTFVGGPVFSYMVASVVLCLMMLGAWAYNISHIRSDSTDYVHQQRHVSPNPIYIGKITGMKDCRWSETGEPTLLGALVALNREYILASGLLEITYKSGAKVILEGPCKYKVDSDAGGYLAVGKLTARIGERGERRGESAKPQAANPESRNSSLIPHPSSFVVKTPTAVVTDLGTEFGVEVDKNGDTTSYVFQGSIKVQGPAASSIEINLHENDSIRVSRVRETHQDTTATEKVRFMHPAPTFDGARFARWLPRRLSIRVFNTGLGLQEGDADSHWQLSARSDDPAFKPRPAVVTKPMTTLDGWRNVWFENNPVQSQWLSIANGPPYVPTDATYTFRTTFALTGLMNDTAELRLRFAVDDQLRAVRLNGRELPLPDREKSKPWERLETYVCRDGFVEGENVLELDVYNGYKQAIEKGVETSPTGLRVEISGHYDSRGPSSAKNNGDKQPSTTERKEAGQN